MRTRIAILLVTAVVLTSFSQGIVSMGNVTAGTERQHDWTVGRGNARFGFEQYHRFYYVHYKPEKSWDKPYTVVYCGPIRFELHCQARIVIAVFIAVLLSSTIALILGYSSRARRRGLSVNQELFQ